MSAMKIRWIQYFFDWWFVVVYLLNDNYSNKCLAQRLSSWSRIKVKLNMFCFRLLWSIVPDQIQCSPVDLWINFCLIIDVIRIICIQSQDVKWIWQVIAINFNIISWWASSWIHRSSIETRQDIVRLLLRTYFNNGWSIFIFHDVRLTTIFNWIHESPWRKALHDLSIHPTIQLIIEYIPIRLIHWEKNETKKSDALFYVK